MADRDGRHREFSRSELGINTIINFKNIFFFHQVILVAPAIFVPVCYAKIFADSRALGGKLALALQATAAPKYQGMCLI